MGSDDNYPKCRYAVQLDVSVECVCVVYVCALPSFSVRVWTGLLTSLFVSCGAALFPLLVLSTHCVPATAALLLLLRL